MLHYEVRRTPFRQIFREYFAENFVYAIRNIADRRTLKLEKIWWLLWVITSFAASCYAVVKLYHKWDENPVVNVYAPRLEPISTVPFPALTICPLSKSRTDVFNLTLAYELFQNGTPLETDHEGKLRSLAHVCPFSNFWKDFEYREDESVFPTLRSLALPRETLIQWCLWRYRSVDCSKIISKTLTEDGICYTFNAVSAEQLYRLGEISPDFLSFKNSAASHSNWTQDRGYGWNAGSNAYPYRPVASGIKSGLYLMLSVKEIDQELMCTGPHTGFKVIVHPPDEMAMSSELYIRLSTNDALGITVVPSVMQTSQNLRNISPLRRKCFFDNERYLRFFKIYNQMNCAVECMANLTLKKCGCVKFSMPHSIGTKICDASEIGCYRNILKEVFDEQLNTERMRGVSTCKCYPACNSVQYQAQSSRFPFYVQEFSKVAGPAFDKYRGFNLSVLSLSFKYNHYLPVWRRELFGTTRVVAEFGGLFALLMGASVMSLSEIVYYGCVRPLRRERIPRLAINWMFVLPWAARQNPFRVPRNY